ncbi:ABC-F family ATP-binding cassette domain-containing protein [Clostridium pasteurianum]|uniref:ATPase component of ABC transporters with duplicated ATPase domain n=1 Tax=Clostridium pasteurianum BC1 TaxID=86416 RepID=R4K2E0_CLOPA|nr:ABC-F family ATP-binding cassette domain-containing protein [Clostridium pasteurianum]AGK96743.1 ATPase component of ABC transporters with duplicated ATPase domain [Clostridium pasteurianum BC1]
MNLISLENIKKSYGEKILFDDISLGINEGQKIGLIGINGTGKSTLLKIITGIDSADEGKIITKNKIKIEYLSQNTSFTKDDTVMEAIFKGNSPVMILLREYEKVVSQLSKNPQDETIQNKFNNLSEKMDALDAWNVESDAKAILTKLGIKDFEAKVETLSGGQKKRIALASALIAPSDLLILDEPTNHIDDATVNWLESYLNSRKGSLIMITHDRYFLDRIVTEILELYKGKLYSYEGNYSKYLEQKIERLSQMEAQEQKRQSLIKSELKWIRRGAKARSTKQKARIDRFEILQNENMDLTDGKVEISVGNTRLGKKIIEINDISINFGDKTLIDDFSYIINREDRIGIVGPNGMGKSTLLNIISGKLRPTAGEVEIGETVKLGYFSQEYRDIDETLRVIDYIKETAEYMSTADGSLISASQMLEKFLFPGVLQYTPISRLSGGEKRRLYLLKVLMEAPNVLLLDEPTNDLDIETLNILEEYIEEFTGTVVAVSHDRYFLDKVSNKIFAFEGEGKIIEHTGNYTDYLEFHNDIVEEENDLQKIKNKGNQEKQVRNNKREKTLKFTFKEQKEYEEIESNINETENSLEEINNEISNSSSDYVTLQELMDKKEKTEEHLNYLLERWMYLSELAEKINNQKS